MAHLPSLRLIGEGLRGICLTTWTKLPGDTSDSPAIISGQRLSSSMLVPTSRPTRGSAYLQLQLVRDDPWWTPPSTRIVSGSWRTAGFVDHQHRVRFAEVFDDELPQVLAQPVGVPHRPVEQMLHPIGRGIAGVLGDGPAVLAGRCGELCTETRRTAAEFPPELTAQLPIQQLVGRHRPPSSLYAVPTVAAGRRHRCRGRPGLFMAALAALWPKLGPAFGDRATALRRRVHALPGPAARRVVPKAAKTDPASRSPAFDSPPIGLRVRPPVVVGCAHQRRAGPAARTPRPAPA